MHSKCANSRFTTSSSLIQEIHDIQVIGCCGVVAVILQAQHMFSSLCLFSHNSAKHRCKVHNFEAGCEDDCTVSKRGGGANLRNGRLNECSPKG